jgi:DNA-3-methyladenine glycosylase
VNTSARLAPTSSLRSETKRGKTSPGASAQSAVEELTIAARAIRRLKREELPINTIKLARFLIGKIVVHDLPEGRVSGRIVEDEAYPPGDPAGHHYRGPTPRIRSMYKAPGHAYVFFNYGNHFMLNVVSEIEGTAAAVLIRALEPLDGIALMQANRGTERLLDLTRGPGRLAAALKITRAHDGLDLTAPGSIWLGELVKKMRPASKTRMAPQIATTIRIGITRAADWPLRFFERDNPYVSGPKHLLVAARESALRRKAKLPR